MGLILNVGSRTLTYNIVGSDSTVNLAQHDIVNVENGNGIVQGSGINSDLINVDGEVHVTGGSGLQIAGLANTITAGFDSIITGPIGIWLLNGTADSGLRGNTLLTEGQIAATAVGIRNEDLGTVIQNFGTLHADKAIVGVTYGLTVTNKHLATIEGDSRGIDLTGVTDASQQSRIVNDGTISGDIAIAGGGGRESVTNHGTIHGNVDLGGGNDVFDGRSGVVVGLIQGGNDNDTYIVDSADVSLHEEANGGTADTVESTVSFKLGGNFENLFLLGAARASAIGNGEDNDLHGNSSANKLKGGAGEDFLYGGKGNDVLTGGADADSFIFQDGFGDDRITDFGAKGRNHDVLYLADVSSISGFSDLMKHHVRQHHDDVVIDAGHGDSITLLHVSKADLHASDFAFFAS